MIKSKIVFIGRVLDEGEFRHAEMERWVESYEAQGWEVKNAVPTYSNDGTPRYVMLYLVRGDYK